MVGWVVTLYLLVSALHDLVCLRHFSKREVLEKINLMEDQFDVHMRFDLDCIPANTPPAIMGIEFRSWDYRVAMLGTAREHRREVEMPLLMANMYRFESREELSATKACLKGHGNYQLEQVSVT